MRVGAGWGAGDGGAGGPATVVVGREREGAGGPVRVGPWERVGPCGWAREGGGGVDPPAREGGSGAVHPPVKVVVGRVGGPRPVNVVVGPCSRVVNVVAGPRRVGP